MAFYFFKNSTNILKKFIPLSSANGKCKKKLLKLEKVGRPYFPKPKPEFSFQETFDKEAVLNNIFNYFGKEKIVHFLRHLMQGNLHLYLLNNKILNINSYAKEKIVHFLRHLMQGNLHLYLLNNKILNINSYAINLNQLRCLQLTSHLEKTISFNLSDIGEGIREVTVKEWFVKVGDNIEQFQNICEVQSDKASVTITSRYDGKITKLYHKVDEIALVGSPLVDFEIEDEDEANSSSSSSSDSEGEIKDDQPSNLDDKENSKAEIDIEERLITLATPAVRRIAKEYKVDLSKVPATGRGGRVLKGDVMEFLGQVPPGTNIPHPTIATLSTTLKPTPTHKTEPLKGVRKVMSKSMAESLKIPHFSYCDEIDMTKLFEFRSQLLNTAKEHGVPKLTFMPFCIKAASIALGKFPILNSSFDADNETVIYKDAHNISVAIDTPQGLVVPNIKNCQSKSILQIAKDLNALVDRGRSNSLIPEDFFDGTFSLSNIGIIGGTYSHPCILAPQVSIGAMGKTKVLPRFNENGELVKAYIMNVSWSADHRVIDGVTMARFSNVWKEHLENPALFLICGD